MTLQIALALVLLAAPGEPITKKNWLKHPRIESIRAKVKAIDDTVGTPALKHETNPACEQPSIDMERDAHRDSSGRIRLYEWGGGSSDSAYSMKQYYDETGQLIFVYATMGAVSDISIQFRIYFEGGKEIWRDRTSTGSGGWTFDQNFPNKYLSLDPEMALKAPKKCN